MFSEVWSLLMDKNMGVVGIYGKGGVGKTTLLNKINNEFPWTQHDFDVVISVVVSKDLRLEKVQEEIAKRTGLLEHDNGWKEENFGEKAEDILNVLQRKKFALLLDDIWERVDLTRVRVPLSELQNGSKVVFTTHSEQVCRQMDANESIKVKPLPWEDAWSLFLKKVGEDTLKVDPDITRLAQDVARKCGGLPIALITVARAMACKNILEEWEHGLEILRNSASNLKDIEVDEMVQDVELEVFTPLKFSYDSLQNRKVRSCFLYCSLFPEDFQIMKEELIHYWICEKFCDRKEGYNIIGTLIRVCLLESEGEYVKMHDVIRDTALWIVCKCNNNDEGKFFVRTGTEAVELPEDEEWEAVSRMSLMKNSLRHICKVPKCSTLSTLFLSYSWDLDIIKGKFFQFMHSLAVLDLSHTDLEQLASSICHLISLRYLNLSGTRIDKLPPEFSNLVSLRYLNLSNTFIKELPEEISKFFLLEYLNISVTDITKLSVELKMLTKLQYLNMEDTPMNYIPRQVICSLSSLRVLRMFRCPRECSKIKDGILKDGNKQMEELQSLSHLNELSTTIRHASALQCLFNVPRFQHSTQAPLLLDFDGRSLDVSSLADMKHLHSLHIQYSSSLKELTLDFMMQGVQTQATAGFVNKSFHSLQKVDVMGCRKLQDMTWLTLCLNLKWLKLGYNRCLKDIINVEKAGEIAVGEESPEAFVKLEVLELINLTMLKSIHWKALSFPVLRRIKVLNCLKLKKFPLNANSAQGCKVIINGQIDW